MEKELYLVALFPSINYTLRAEKRLKERGIPCKLIPVPRQLSSDCGVCLRFEDRWEEEVRKALASNGITVDAICAIS